MEDAKQQRIYYLNKLLELSEELISVIDEFGDNVLTLAELQTDESGELGHIEDAMLARFGSGIKYLFKGYRECMHCISTLQRIEKNEIN